MKPRTKLHRRVMSLSAKLPAITEAQRVWAQEHCFTEYFAYRSAKSLECFECGHKWQEAEDFILTALDGCVCPECGKRLKVRQSKAWSFRAVEYMCILSVRDGFQVVRLFCLNKFSRRGASAWYTMGEVVQHWIGSDGKYTTVARLTSQGYSCSDRWNYSTPLEIRESSHRYGRDWYGIRPTAVYPAKRIMPQLRRNGFKGDLHDTHPVDLFKALLTRPKAETLLKAGQYALLRSYLDNDYSVTHKWASVKMCLRNGYKVRDGSIWLDYVALLDYFGMDVHNAKYVCPKLLNKEHDRLVEKKRIAQERERLEFRKRRAQDAQELYAKEKSKFFGLKFTDGDLEVVSLDSVADFVKEGETLKHCVFGCGYHLKKESLILSAKVDGAITETIEVSLKTMGVVQCRGKFNKDSPHHDRILALVKDNMSQIASRKKRNQPIKTDNYGTVGMQRG